MASLDKQEIFSIFVSFLIGSVAGWWSRMYWGSHLITTLATLIGIVSATTPSWPLCAPRTT